MAAQHCSTSMPLYASPLPLLVQGEVNSEEEEEVKADDGVSEGFEEEEGDEVVKESDGKVGGDPGPEEPLGGDAMEDVGSEYDGFEEVEPDLAVSDPEGQGHKEGDADEAEAYSGGDFED